MFDGECGCKLTEMESVVAIVVVQWQSYPRTQTQS